MPKNESLDAHDAFAEALERARARLGPPMLKPRAWPALAAAGLLAVSAMVFATAAILTPPAQLVPVTEVRGPA